MSQVNGMLEQVIDNSPDGLRRALEIATECRDGAADVAAHADGHWTLGQAAMFTAADQLKAWLEDILDGLPKNTFDECLVAQMLQTSLEEVNWNNLASNYLHKVREGASVPD